MSDRYLIGIDVGTTLAKAGVYNTRGECISTCTEKAPEECPKPGVYIQSGEEFFRIVVKLLKNCISSGSFSPNRIEAVGFSGQMGGAVGVDRNWQPVTDWSNGLDTRYVPYTTRMIQTDQEGLLTYSGTNFPYFAPKLLWWKQEYPELYKRTAKFLILSGYIAGRMSDTPVDRSFMDHTFMQMTGIADIPRCTWREELVREFGIDMDKLPIIVRSSDIVGKLNKAVADECGLPSGIPLVSGAGDKPAGYLAAGMVQPGLMIDEAGSFAAFSVCVDSYIPDKRYKTLEMIPSPLPGFYYPTIVIIGSGTTHRWFVEAFGADDGEGTGESAFTILDRKAGVLPPGSDKLVNIGLLGGRGYPPDPDVRGTWIGFSWGHRKEHFYRSILEGFAYENAYAFEAMRENYPALDFKEVRVIGGGAKSALWNQIKSDVLGVPYVKLSRDDFTLLGDVLLAGSAVGIYDNLQEAASWFVSHTELVEPDPKRHAFYEHYVQLYRSLFHRMRDVYTDVKNLPEFE